MNELDFKQNPVFICGHRKTGTSLLINLLDNHPELLVLPDDSGFFYKYYPFYDSDKFSSEEKINTMTENIIGNLRAALKKISEEDEKSLNLDADNIEKDFKEIAVKTNPTPKDMLISLVTAFHKNFKNSTNPKRWVEKTTSTEVYALDVFKWFPNAKFIHLIRDPRDNWASLKSGWEKRYKGFNDSLQRLMQSMIERGRLGMQFAKINQEIFGKDKYKIIKFEELTQNPEKVMKEVCEFIGVNFTENVLKPTIYGKSWKGNNFDGLKFEAVSNINVNRWKERIEENEAKLIEFHFADVMKYFDYKQEYSSKDAGEAAKEHYKWHNFAQAYSFLTTQKKRLK